LKRECHSKTAVQLRECSPKALRSISRVSVADLLSFTQNSVQTYCSIIAIHHWQNETQSQKSTRVKTICVHGVLSRGKLME
jgi:hypothetical protein